MTNLTLQMIELAGAKLLADRDKKALEEWVDWTQLRWARVKADEGDCTEEEDPLP